MKRKRLLCLLVMLVVLLAACSTPQPSDSNSGPDSDTADSTANNEVEQSNEESEAPVKLSIFIQGHPAVIDYNENRATKWAEEQVGVSFEFTVAPQGTGEEKMNLLLNSKNYPDIWMGPVPDENLYGIETPILLELTDIIQEHMPNLVKEITDFPEIGEGMKALDGNIYSVPNYNYCHHCLYPRKMWYNTMQLDKLGMEVPETAEEFRDTLMAYKEANPDGIPLTGNVEQIIGFLTNMYTYYPGNYSQYGLVLTDGTVSTMLDSEGYRKALSYMRDLYKDGLLYEGTFSMDDTQLKALLTSEGEPVLFLGSQHNVAYIDGTQTPELYAHTRAIAPLKGDTRYASFAPLAVTPGAAISSTCENVEKAAAFMDLFYDPVGNLNMRYGEQGVNWDFADEGALSVDGMLPAQHKLLTPYSLEPNNRCWEPTGIYYASKNMQSQGDPNPDFDSPDFGADLRARVTTDLYVPYYQEEIQTLPFLKFTSEENETLATLSVNIDNYVKQERVAFIVGEKDIDADWDEYVKSLNDMGMSQLVELYQKAYDRLQSK